MQPLLAAPRGNLTEAVVLDALDLSRGIKLRHGVDVLDNQDRPTGETLPFESGSVTWRYRPVDMFQGPSTDAAEVRRTATINLVGPVTVPLIARRYRLWTDLLSPAYGVWVRFWLGVFITTLPGANDDGTVIRRTLQLADKTSRYKQRTLPEPVHLEAGTSQVDAVKTSLTSEFGETQFAIAASTVTLTEARTFAAGISYLEYYNALLESAAMDQLTTDEAGRPRSVPLASLADRGPEAVYAPGAGKVITPASVEPLMPTQPNVARFVARQGPSLQEEGNGIATRTNQSSGPASIDQRGDAVLIEVQVEAEGQPELEAIADAESQRYFGGGGERAMVQIGINPRFSDRDVIELRKPRLGLTGVWLVTEWTLQLQKVTSESAVLMQVTGERRVAAGFGQPNPGASFYDATSTVAAVQSATTLAGVQSACAPMASEYGITVVLPSTTTNPSASWTTPPLTSANLANAKTVIAACMQSLAQYPVAFVKRTGFASLVFVQDIVHTDGGEAGGLYQHAERTIWIDAEDAPADWASGKIFHHEFAHCIQGGSTMSGDRWVQQAALNDPAFPYGGGWTSGFTGRPPGYTLGGWASAVEDEAEIHAFHMTAATTAQFQGWLASDSILAAKFALWRSFLSVRPGVT